MIEAATNTAVGVVGSWVISFWAITYFKDPIAVTNAAVIGCTIWSLLRGYGVRRFFNWLWRAV